MTPLDYLDRTLEQVYCKQADATLFHLAGDVRRDIENLIGINDQLQQANASMVNARPLVPPGWEIRVVGEGYAMDADWILFAWEPGSYLYARPRT